MSDFNGQASPQKIEIVANGSPRVIEAGSSVADLLKSLDISPSRVVVQLDGNIVWQPDLGKTLLKSGSRLEIVTMVGGG